MFDGDSNWKRKHNRYLMGILAYLAWFGPNMYEGSFTVVQG